VVKPPRFNAHFDIEDVKPMDGAAWTPELAGRIENKTPWSAAWADHHQAHLRRGLGYSGWLFRHRRGLSGAVEP